ncbi:MAG: hypothetical protein ACE5D8_06320 [Fidelibacterota bacterium]
MSSIKLLIPTLILFITACEKKTGEVHSTVPIESAIRHIELEGYDGLIKFDWDIMNTSDHPVDGWEVKVSLVTSDSLQYTGVFFDYDAPLEAGDTLGFNQYVMFYIDANSVYPIRLRSDVIGLHSLTTLYTWGIIKD